MLLALFSAMFLAGCVLGVLAVVMIGIHASRHRPGNFDPPATHAEHAARRVLGVYVRRPAELVTARRDEQAGDTGWTLPTGSDGDE